MTPLFQGQVDVNRSTKAKFAGVSFDKKFRHHRKIDSDDDFHSPCQKGQSLLPTTDSCRTTLTCPIRLKQKKIVEDTDQTKLTRVQFSFFFQPLAIPFRVMYAKTGFILAVSNNALLF